MFACFVCYLNIGRWHLSASVGCWEVGYVYWFRVLNSGIWNMSASVGSYTVEDGLCPPVQLLYIRRWDTSTSIGCLTWQMRYVCQKRVLDSRIWYMSTSIGCQISGDRICLRVYGASHSEMGYVYLYMVQDIGDGICLQVQGPRQCNMDLI